MGSVGSLPADTFPYRIGVDVGGTNTDAVIIDTTIIDKPRSVLASHKATTTSPNVADGIERAVSRVLELSAVDRSRIASLAIGTTHFINAIVEHDERHLLPVAVIRLSKSFTREIPPFSGFPSQLRRIMKGYCTQLDGGLQIDGSQEAPIIKSQVLQCCEEIRKRGLTAVVISGVFSPLDNQFHQEQTVRKIIQEQLPTVGVVCSSEISNLGFLERENASILNASILHFANDTISRFKSAMLRLELGCGLYLTQNDGTLIDAATASLLPIRTFTSGPTNSMRGAAYLGGFYDGTKGNAPTTIVCDVGGTTSDFGVLLPSGYPRRTAGDATISGVQVNYHMPQVESIGIGGGSIIREVDGKVTVGTDSVGCLLKNKALIFGGNTMTATDVAVSKGIGQSIGDPSLVRCIGTNTKQQTEAFIKREWERICDKMKTAPEPLPLILVGGGSIISPSALDGISEIIRPPHHDVANAVGAAIARVSATVDTIRDVGRGTTFQAVEAVTAMARAQAVRNGADQVTISITEQEVLPLQYVDGKVRVIVKAVGDFSLSLIRNEKREIVPEKQSLVVERKVELHNNGKARETIREHVVDVINYKPCILTDENSGTRSWLVSPTDLEWLADGCYLLGCGGGGSPYPEMLKLRQHIERGHKLRIVELETLKDEAQLYWAGNMGSPAVPAERLSASESILAMKTMMEYHNHSSFDGMIGIEIGGSNGLQPLTIGSSQNFDVPTVDADWMGRAFPNLWQVTIAVQEKDQIIPCSIASGDGRALIMTKSPTDKLIDSTLRAPTIDMGYYVGFCAKPTSAKLAKKWAVKNTMSQAWRIGRCIAKSRQTNTIGSVTEQIIQELGGSSSAKLLFRGKIVGIERRLFKGHSHGEVIIQDLANVAEESDQSGKAALSAEFSGGQMKIPFMNENLLARHTNDSGAESVVASVPDLITVLNASNGKALGIGEYRYGVIVNVLGIACSPIWNGNDKGLEAGGPGAFGFDEVLYKPLGTYSEPRSVIAEFA